MKKLKGILVLVLLLALLASPIAVLASDISGARYYGTIIVTNNSTATTYVAVNCTISTANLINGGYLNSSANNCVVRSSAGADLPFMPSVNDSYPWCIWVPSIGSNASVADILYTANSTGGEIRYFPAAEGMNTTDNETMELGDNFTVEQKGWWDTDYSTSANKTAVEKPRAFRIYIGSSENITAEILAEIPTGDNDPSSDWTNDSNARDDNLTTYATGECPTNDWGGYLYLPQPAVRTGNVRYYLDTATDADITKIDIDAYYDGTWNDVFEGADVEGAWVEKSLGKNYYVSNARVRFFNNSGAGVREAELAEVRYGSTPEISATGVSSGEYVVKVDTASVNSSAVTMDGTGDYISTGNYTNLRVAGDNFTIEMWVRFDDLTVHQGLFEQKNGANNVQNCYRSKTSGKILWRIHNPGEVVDYQKSWTPVIDTWYFVVCRNEGDNWQIYIDDSGLGNVVDADDMRNDADTTNFGSGAGTYMKGDIDGIRFYDEALSTSNMTAHYNAGLGSKDTANMTNLQGWWPLDDGAGTTAEDISGNDYDGTLEANATWADGLVKSKMAIYIDGTEQDSVNIGNIAIPNNSENWTFCQNDGLRYLEYQDIEIGGVQQQRIEWEYNDTTFTDLSGNSHNASPTFRTTSSDPDVSAVLTSFLPVSEAKAPAYALEDAPPFIETVPTIVSEWDVTPPAGTFPLAGVITAIANATSTPPQLPLLVIAVFVILAFSLAISATMRQYGSGSLIVKSLVITALMGLFIGIGNFGIDFWMLFVFLVIAVALMMGSKQVGWQ